MSAIELTRQATPTCLPLAGVPSTSELPLRLVLEQLPAGCFDIVDEQGVKVAKLEKFGPSLPTLIREQLSPQEFEELRQQMQEPRVLSNYDDVRQRVFV